MRFRRRNSRSRVLLACVAEAGCALHDRNPSPLGDLVLAALLSGKPQPVLEFERERQGGALMAWMRAGKPGVNLKSNNKLEQVGVRFVLCSVDLQGWMRPRWPLCALGLTRGALAGRDAAGLAPRQSWGGARASALGTPGCREAVKWNGKNTRGGGRRAELQVTRRAGPGRLEAQPAAGVVGLFSLLHSAPFPPSLVLPLLRLLRSGAAAGVSVWGSCSSRVLGTRAKVNDCQRGPER